MNPPAPGHYPSATAGPDVDRPAFVVAIRPVGDHFELGNPADEGFKYLWLPDEWRRRLVNDNGWLAVPLGADIHGRVGVEPDPE